MTTTELVKSLAERLGISQREARDLLTLMRETIVTHLETHETVVLRGFGSFGIRRAKARKSYNPSAKKFMRLPPKIMVFFRPSEKLKERLSARRKA